VNPPNPTDLGTLSSGDHSDGRGITSAGHVTGFSNLTAGSTTYHAFFYHDGQMHDLGTFSGGTYSEGYGINESDHIVGRGDRSDGSTHAFFYNGTSMRDMGTLGGTDSNAYAVNVNDVSVGWANLSNGNQHAFKYTLNPSTMTDLGTLGGNTSWAWAVNDVGDVAGYSTTSTDTNHHAALYTGTWRDLGFLSGDGISEAEGVNHKDQVVGFSKPSGNVNDQRAFIWDAVNGMQNLTSLCSGSGWTLFNARAINDNGLIVGGGQNSLMQVHAFLLIPTTSPGVPPLVLKGVEELPRAVDALTIVEKPASRQQVDGEGDPGNSASRPSGTLDYFWSAQAHLGEPASSSTMQVDPLSLARPELGPLGDFE
jgi:probable HAF family extracellular repeat protein